MRLVESHRRAVHAGLEIRPRAGWLVEARRRGVERLLNELDVSYAEAVRFGNAHFDLFAEESPVGAELVSNGDRNWRRIVPIRHASGFDLNRQWCVGSGQRLVVDGDAESVRFEPITMAIGQIGERSKAVLAELRADVGVCQSLRRRPASRGSESDAERPSTNRLGGHVDITMYTTCIFCHEPLGANETIEHFPIGRRLAFDSAKGRLWVVCRNCAQWNLTPLEERWEAVEACERAYRSVRTRVSTPEIGLARLAEGLDLVRIGAPLRPEFAAWRFGDEFSRRRRRAIQVGVVGTGLVAGAGITFGFGLAAAGVAGPLVGYGAMWMLGAARAVVGKWTSRFPHPLDLTADDGSRVRFGRQYIRDILMRTDHSPHAPLDRLEVRMV